MSDMRAVLNKIMEMSTPKHLPGAVAGIKIMSPEEFAQTSTEEEIDETNSPISMPSDYGPAGRRVGPDPAGFGAARRKASWDRRHTNTAPAIDRRRVSPRRTADKMTQQQFISGEDGLEETQMPTKIPSDYGPAGKVDKHKHMTQAERERRASSGVGPDGRMTQVERERRMMSQPYDVDEAKGWDDKEQANEFYSNL